MRTVIIATTVLLLLAAYIVSPYFALYRIDSALQARDTVMLERAADWPGLREQLRADFKGAIVNAGQSVDGDLAKGMVALLGPVLVDQLVDSTVNPDGVLKLIDNGTQPAKRLRRLITYAFFAGPLDFRVDLKNPDDRALLRPPPLWS